MLQFVEQLDGDTDTYEHCLAVVKAHGVESLKRILERQDCEEEIDRAELTKLEEKYIFFQKVCL